MSADGSSTRAEPWPGDFLLDPAVLGSIALLVLNDWVVKQRWPGSVSGKLSDVAGMVFFPLLLVALAELALRIGGSGRLATVRWFVISAALVAAVFALTKVSPPVREVDEWVLAGIRWAPAAAGRVLQGGAAGSPGHHDVVADASDVLCVPFVLVAVWVGTRYRPTPARSTRASG